jgi:hypothetical protein
MCKSFLFKKLDKLSNVMKKMRKEILIVFFIIASIYPINAAKVGVVVEFPDNEEIFTRCLEVSEGTNGYDVLNSVGLSLTWSYHALWGHSLCGINGIGCPSDNCWCDYPNYWGFFTKKITDRSWKYSPVGFDGGSSCSEHYCATHGNLLGFAYGAYGTKPPNYSFEDVCPPQERRRIRKFSVSIQPKEPKKGDKIIITVKDSETLEGIRNAEIEIFSGLPGTSKKIFSGKTDKDGSVELKIDEVGNYKIRLNVRKYNPPQAYHDLVITKKEPTINTTTTNTSNITNTLVNTTTTTTTTEITTTTTSVSPLTTFTTMMITKTTTTPQITTTTLKTVTTTINQITTTVEERPLGVIGAAIKFSTKNTPTILGLLLLLLLLGYFTFKKFERK